MRKLILVLNILVMMVCAVWGQSNVWDGKPADNLNPIEGNKNVYHISTAAELAKLADLVNGGDNFAGKTVILQNDIVLNVGVLDDEGKLNSGQFHEWTPIGNSDNPFQGIFDGNGNKVSGVYIVDDTRGADLGLFGYLGEGGRIENVGVEDSYVKGTFEYVCVGGVCGENQGSILSSYNAGSVMGTGQGAYVGGVCGCNDNSTAAGVSTITSCFYLAGTAKNGVGVGDGDDGVKPKELSTEFIGAVENWLEAIDTDPDSWEGELGFEEGKLTLPNLKGGEPVIVYPPVPGLVGGFYQIYTGDQLRWFAKRVNGEVDEIEGEDGKIQGKLMQDIAVSGYTLDNGTPPDLQDHWTPIGNKTNRFQGIFDGNGNTVSGVYINDNNDGANLGLFGYLGKGGKIENVGVEDSYGTGRGGQATVGGVCGSSEGSILSSYNAGSVEGTQSPALVGGVCGSSDGSISNSYNTGSVEGETISLSAACVAITLSQAQSPIAIIPVR